TTSWHNSYLCARNALLEGLGIDDRSESVRLPPQNEGRGLNTMYALLQTFVRNRPEKFACRREVLHAYEVRFQLGFFVLRYCHHRPGHVRLRIMPEGDRELLWRHREEIGNRMVV